MDLSYIALIISSTATFAIAIFAFVQLRLIRKERDVSVILSIISPMLGLRDKWNDLHTLPLDHKKWSKEQNKIAAEVGVNLQQTAWLSKLGLCKEEYLFENYAAVFYRSWVVLKEFIEDYRESNGEPRQIGKNGAMGLIHFEIFAKESKNYLKKNFPHLVDFIDDNKGRGNPFF